MTDEAAAAAVVLVRAQAQTRQATRDVVAARVRARITGFRGWWDDDQVRALARDLARIVGAGQRSTAAGTAAYAARILTAVLGADVQPVAVVDPAPLRGVPLETVMARVAAQYRSLSTAQDQGSALTDDEVLERAVRRGATMADTSLTLAMRAQWAASLGPVRARVAGYRRVIHPELALTSGVCGLCIAASDQLYRVGDLLPIHDGCGCGVVPVVGAPGGPGDPGAAMNRGDLEQLYGAAGSTSSYDLRRTRYRVVTHSELGVVLEPQSRSDRAPSAAAQ